MNAVDPMLEMKTLDEHDCAEERFASCDELSYG